MRLIASGRTADVYELDERRVLRRFRHGWSPAAEASLMGYLAGLDYPVPAVLAVDGPDLILERIAGPNMVEAMAGGALDVDEAQRMLAGLHRRLHALPPRIGRDPQDRILHLDLHPENVLIDAGRGPVVIDWTTATEGPPAFDVAVTALIYAEIAVDPGHQMAGPAGAALAAFLRHAGMPPAEMVARALALRTANPSLSDEEKSRLPDAAALIRR